MMKRTGGGVGTTYTPRVQSPGTSPKDKRPQGTGLTNQASVLHAGWQGA